MLDFFRFSGCFWIVPRFSGMFLDLFGIFRDLSGRDFPGFVSDFQYFQDCRRFFRISRARIILDFSEFWGECQSGFLSPHRFEPTRPNGLRAGGEALQITYVRTYVRTYARTTWNQPVLGQAPLICFGQVRFGAKCFNLCWDNLCYFLVIRQDSLHLRRALRNRLGKPVFWKMFCNMFLTHLFI